mmetsp:Transcript_31305/g.101632  ORF Transcript_31305/g.101632 Transcript_31305/m.101632 type:complete len:276 (+) Transcript_31305:435-1262(+)
MVAPLLLTRGLSALVHGIETPARATQVLAFLSLGTFRLGKLEDGRACRRCRRGCRRARRANPEIAAATSAARRGEAVRGPRPGFGGAFIFWHNVAEGERERARELVTGEGQGRQRRELADLGRERAGHLVAVEPQGRQRRELADLGRDRAGDAALPEPQVLQRRELADLGRDRAGDPVVEEAQLDCARGVVALAEDAHGGADRSGRVVEIAAVRRAARRDEVVAGLGGTVLDVAEGERERAGDLVFVEVPTTPRRGRAPRRASGTRGELAGISAP